MDNILTKISVFFAVFLLPCGLCAQGSPLFYFYSPQTELPYASCQVTAQNGATFICPFLPIVNILGAPCGSFRYTRNINVAAPLVFIGDGLSGPGSSDCYEGVDIEDKIVLFGYDAPASTSQQLGRTMEERITKAVSRGACGIVL